MIDRTVQHAWLAYWRCMRLYHRYDVEGFEHLTEPGPALLVCYHGRGIALDLCLLSVDFQDRLGYLPHAVFHKAFARVPVIRRTLQALGGVTGDNEVLAAAVGRGEHLVVLPGGAREGFRSFRTQNRVDWGDRLGYLKLALRLGVPVIPVAATGLDQLFWGLNDGYRLGKRLGMPLQIPIWFALGATGVYPLSLPFPVRIRQRIGARIDLTAAGSVDPDHREALLPLHEQVTAAVQTLLDQGSASYCGAPWH